MPRIFPKKFRHEFAVFRPLTTPAKVQDFLNALSFNHERPGEDTLRSPREVLRVGKAHCLEGAMLAAAALWYHGHPPLLLDLRTTKKKPLKDFDHVVALFRVQGSWGAISKTNHAVLRYREPIYRDVRELAVSYFHEYFLHDGNKTMRDYSRPFDMRYFNDDWLTSAADLWDIGATLDDIKHYPILTPRAIKNLRLADPIERKAGKIEETKKRS